MTLDSLLKSDEMINASDYPRRSDKFYVNFPTMRENINNFLGKFVATFTRPRIEFDMGQTSHRSKRYVNIGQYLRSPITISFYEDSQGLVETILMSQVLRQTNQLPDNLRELDNKDSAFKFDVELRYLDERNKPTGGMMLRDCVISSLEAPPFDMASEESTRIDAVIEYDAIELRYLDKWINLG